MQIDYLIIDDEPLAHDLIKRYAQDLPHLHLCKQCYNALEALAYLQTKRIDLIFLDLQMPKLKGFDFLRSLPHPPKVIVTTAHQEYALEGFELQVADYLLKPYSFARFLKAVNNAFPADKPTPNLQAPAVKPQKSRQLFVKGDKQFHQLTLSDILYVEAYGNYTKVHLADQMLLTHASISYYAERLAETNFLRVHKSFLVPISKIERIAGNRIFIEGHEIPIGQTYRQMVLSLLE